MKSSLKYITISIIVLFGHSCLKENFNNCPDWGKYKVGFFDSSSVNNLSINYIILLYNGIDSTSAPLLKKYFLKPYSSVIDSPSVLKLYPGEYHFCALLSSQELFLNDKVKLKNGLRYFYANTKNQIKKSPFNKVPLFFNLANSMIAVNCSLDSSLDVCNISRVEISPPEEKNALLNLSDGTCSYEGLTSEYFDTTIFNSKENEWTYYCNPTVPGNDLTFKVILINSNSTNYKTLITKVFLDTGLEQGKVYKFHLNVTPNKIEYLSSSIIDWIDYIYPLEIML